ncbi:MAG: hypothetical protein JKY11_09175 [Alphaproteobacteria bacterium]|nr:hypothetical protein [Alphaproteobacteria bacterium]
MGRLLTFNDVRNSESWRKQIQLSSSFAATFTDKPVKSQNLILYRRSFDGSMKAAFRELTQFYLDEYEVSANEGKILYGEGALQMFSPTKGTDHLSLHAQNAAVKLTEDISRFSKLGGRGQYLRLRVQGGELTNIDSIWHHDGAATKGIRYSGALTHEVHNDDVRKIVGTDAEVIDEARILIADHGDVWQHNAPSFFNPFTTMKHRIHRKAPIDGQPGLILTLQ